MSETTLPFPDEEAFHEGKQLRNYLDFHLITQSQLAQRMGLTHQGVNRNIQLPRISRLFLKRLLKTLGASYEEVFSQPLPLDSLVNEGEHLKAYLKKHRIKQRWLAQKLCQSFT